MTRTYSPIACAGCGIEIVRTSGNQRFCRPCRTEADRETIRRWDAANSETRRTRAADRRRRTPAAEAAAQRRWYEANAETKKAKRRARRAANPESEREKARQYREKYPERAREAVRRYVAAHPEVPRLNVARRNARKKGNGVFTVTVRDWRRLVARFRGCCAYCGAGDRPLTQEHVIPIVRGGRHSIGNLLPVCQPCNSSKKDRLLVEWRHA